MGLIVGHNPLWICRPRPNPNQTDLTAQMWRQSGCNAEGPRICAWQSAWVGPAAEEGENIWIEKRNNVGVRCAPVVSLVLLLLYTRLSHQGEITSQLETTRGIFVWESSVGVVIQVDFIMDQSVAIQESLEREENCIIVSFLRTLNAYLWIICTLLQTKECLLQTNFN